MILPCFRDVGNQAGGSRDWMALWKGAAFDSAPAVLPSLLHTLTCPSDLDSSVTSSGKPFLTFLTRLTPLSGPQAYVPFRSTCHNCSLTFDRVISQPGTTDIWGQVSLMWGAVVCIAG